MSFRVSSGRPLPVEAITETFAVLGRRGSGKTYTAGVLVEEFLEAKFQVVVLDPLDAWYGLRSSADGKGDGYPILIFGGAHQDAPLLEGAGSLLADVVIEHGISAIFSLRHLSKAGARRFVAAFCDRLYERKGEAKHRSPLHLVVDEADAFVPQHLSNDATSCYGAIDTIVRRGRSSGFGTTLISQRSAVIAKDVLTQTEVMVAHQTTGPQDRKALEAWIEAHDTEGSKAAFLASLASLHRGVAWWWSPGMLDIFEKATTRKKRTFDSSSTPRGGERPAEPKRMTPVDLAALEKRIAATVEEAKASDPKALRSTIADLRRQLAERTVPPPERVEVPVLREEDVATLTTIAEDLRECAEIIEKTGTNLIVEMGRVRKTSDRPTAVRPPAPVVLPRPRDPMARRAGEVVRSGLTAPQQRILDTVAMLAVRGIEPSRTTIAAWQDIHPNGGSYSENLAHLRNAGYLDGVGLTPSGNAIADPGETGYDAAARVLTGPQAKLLEALYGHQPTDRVGLAKLLGIHPNGGSYSENLARLRAMGLITRGTPMQTTPGLDR